MSNSTSNARASVSLALAITAVVISIVAVVIALNSANQHDGMNVSSTEPMAEQNKTTPEAQQPTVDASQDPNSTRIEYEITTDGMSVTNLSYVVWKDGKATMVDDDGAPAPFRQVVDIPKGQTLADFSVTGVGGTTSHDVTCTIRVNGKVVDTQSASGAYPIASCVAQKG